MNLKNVFTYKVLYMYLVLIYSVNKYNAHKYIIFFQINVFVIHKKKALVYNFFKTYLRTM